MTRGRLWSKAPVASGGTPGVVVLRWDLDKTYLRSDFDRVRDLVRIPFERGSDKVAAPGAAALIRALRGAARRDGREVRIYFLTASPPQIGKAIKEKLELDRIEYDGIAFKDQLQHLVRGKFHNLREQVGFKLAELLKGREPLPPDVREFLFGDDWESDPLAYSLYADVLAGRMDTVQLAELLQALRVDPRIGRDILQRAARVTRGEAVTRIFISLERRTPPADLRSFGKRLVPTFNYFQTAVCLHAEGMLGADDVAAVGRCLIDEWGYTEMRLANSLVDVVRRGFVPPRQARALCGCLRRCGLMPRTVTVRALRQTPLWWVRVIRRWRRKSPLGPTEPAVIDYRALVSGLRAAR